MEILTMRNMLSSGRSIYDMSLKVTYYARVSTERAEQLNSLDSQVMYFENLIKEQTNWTFIPGYVDEGISGASVNKRDSFLRMIRDAKFGKFDLILTKEVSRFARNTLDSIQYTRDLLNYGVCVYFLSDNINTCDPDAELRLTIMSSLAQEEIRKLSDRVRFGYQRSIEKGVVAGSNNILGYKKDNGKLVIDEEQAEIVRKIFELYVYEGVGTTKLSFDLYNKYGYTNAKGKPIHPANIRDIIRNPKYKGYYCANKGVTLDFRTKKRKVLNSDNWVMYEDHENVPPIVSEELWDEANRILKSRTKEYENNNYWSGGLKYAFSSKIYCKEHNTSFQRSHGNKNKKRPIWSCGMYLQHRLAACKSPIIAEVDLYNIMSSIMNSIIPQKINIIENMLKLYENIDKNDYYDKELKLLNTKIKIIEEKKSMTLELVFNGDISKESVKVQFNKYDQELKSLNEKKTIIIKQVKQLNNSNNNLNVMAELIEKELNGGSLSEFIRKFVDEIIISKIEGDRYNIKLDIYLDLLGEEKLKIKGARHINGPTTDYILYKKNQTCNTVESKKSLDNTNIFTYDVYVKTF